ncbi:hypothetical protein QAD02_005968 [Eretmocerus hayati]|uniref:Uncharacterized protein n=1 Tax=Eretmocerus hayati TaxID=131215 RepID=A0ACC2N0D7_9HYME|nr:hypothetical protein QAD02_005968 [Eretmocerus hayati]
MFGEPSIVTLDSNGAASWQDGGVEMIENRNCQPGELLSAEPESQTIVTEVPRQPEEPSQSQIRMALEEVSGAFSCSRESAITEEVQRVINEIIRLHYESQNRGALTE